ncbi:glucose-6-phosphate dehydrogenase [Niallia taxi]|nr:glucose-6-phosphate dehydrogenase [Niallia taxi]MDE5054965.1 glucose-6-phosphate dehydrogenase [Niallia taxi]
MESMTFVLFGATGDLAKRKIYPALYNLYLDKKMPQAISVFGLGRKEFTDATFQEHVRKSIETFSRRKAENDEQLEAFIASFRYSILDATKIEDYETLLKKVEKREAELNIPQNRMFYLSVGPEFFDLIALNLKESGLGTTAGWKKLLIEKPFGHDLASARELNERLSKAFTEEEIYRIDHYLGKPMVQNLEALEFANPVLQALWNNKHIANVQITASEMVGVEERAGYYDHVGALRDMVQNHLLQMLMMTAMQTPEKVGQDQIREQKRKVMEALRPVNGQDIYENIVRGQYSSGEVNGQASVGYRDEPNIKENSSTDTFIAARLWIDNDLWEGVPFYIRTGKKMKEKSTRIVIEFKDTLKDLYEEKKDQIVPNLLIIEISPNENIKLLLNSKSPFENGKIEQVEIDLTHAQKDVPEAYERLIFDAFKGDSTFFAHWNEVELSWEWVQPVLDAFEQGDAPLHFYPAGSNGPEASDELLAANGFKWWLDSKPAEKDSLVSIG